MDFGSVAGIFRSIPLDAVFIVVFAVLVAFESMRAGARKALALIFALPVALLAFGVLADTVLVGSFAEKMQDGFVGACLFGIVLLLFSILMYRVVGSMGDTSATPFHALLIGFSTAVMFILVWLQVEPLGNVWEFGSQIQTLFGNTFRLWWLLAAILALTFSRR